QKDNKILATQRGYGEFKDGWEFPGGKIESGEDHTSALVREIKEELAADITVGEHLITVEYEYDNFNLTMHCYLCQLTSEITLLEHEASQWLTKDTLYSVDWLPADVPVADAIYKCL
ncbi:MAG: (deoxy)nucleoside triphosphate pyrophosphohydrolase, partial [Veillonella sp.]|nr:(deoxy)nucleoside triphosphate pyrophosphohydrolase [Veillonella sp.]